jgi:6-bladed beta-propeller protein/NHL repeat-containing protein
VNGSPVMSARLPRESAGSGAERVRKPAGRVSVFVARTRLVLALLLAALSGAGAAAQEAATPTPPKFYIRPTAIFSEHLYEGDFAEPTAAFFDHARNELWVADTKNNLIGAFTPEGVPLFAFGSDQIKEPSRLAVDRKGRVYVLDNDRSKIKVFDYQGRSLGPLELPAAAGAKPSFGALTFDSDGNLYVGENESCQVFVFGPDGKARQRFGECGADPGQFQAISGIAVDKERIVVTDAQVVAVQVFDKHGNLVRSWGRHDMGIQNFSLPASVGLDSKQHVVVIDTLRHEIKFFDLEGNFLERFGGLGRRPGQISFPTSVAVDGDRLFVVEKGNSRVQAFVEVEGDINLAQ